MSATPSNRLSIEIGLYDTCRSEWLSSYRGSFVVVNGNDLLGFFSSFHEAYSAGARKYGIDADFLVRRVEPQEPVFLVF